MIANTGSLSTTTATLDTGNLVLKEAVTGTTIWQSFDLPTDTFLPGMKLGLFGLNTTQRMFDMLVSWENPKNPARGLFTLTMDVLNFTRLSVWRGDGVKMVIAFRDEQGLRFIFENSTRNMYNFSYESNEYEAYYTFSTSKNYDFMWFVMGSTGNLDEYFMLDGKISSVSHALCEDSAGGNSARCLTSMPVICVYKEVKYGQNSFLLLHRGDWIYLDLIAIPCAFVFQIGAPNPVTEGGSECSKAGYYIPFGRLGFEGRFLTSWYLADEIDLMAFGV
ncbi:hypothetical protein ACLB2K_017328 [Fragaria x ananassa]